MVTIGKVRRPHPQLPITWMQPTRAPPASRRSSGGLPLRPGRLADTAPPFKRRHQGPPPRAAPDGCPTGHAGAGDGPGAAGSSPSPEGSPAPPPPPRSRNRGHRRGQERDLRDDIALEAPTSIGVSGRGHHLHLLPTGCSSPRAPARGYQPSLCFPAMRSPSHQCALDATGAPLIAPRQWVRTPHPGLDLTRVNSNSGREETPGPAADGRGAGSDDRIANGHEPGDTCAVLLFWTPLLVSAANVGIGTKPER